MRTRMRPLRAGRRLSGAAPSEAFTPASVAGLVAWYKASPLYCFTDAGLTVRAGDGDMIHTWVAAGGSGIPNLVQATESKRPTLRLVSGRYYVRFDGTDDEIASATRWTAAVDDWTWLYVAKQTAVIGSVNGLVAHNGTGGDTNGYGLTLDGNTDTIGALYPSVAWVTGDVAATINVSAQATVRRAGGTATLRANGSATPAASATATPAAVGDAAQIGSAGEVNHFTGDVAEMLLYAAALTASQVAAAESYLRSAWGTP